MQGEGGEGIKSGEVYLNWEAQLHFRIKKGGCWCWKGLGEDSYSGWYTLLQGFNYIYLIIWFNSKRLTKEILKILITYKVQCYISKQEQIKTKFLNFDDTFLSFTKRIINWTFETNCFRVWYNVDTQTNIMLLCFHIERNVIDKMHLILIILVCAVVLDVQTITQKNTFSKMASKPLD